MTNNHYFPDYTANCIFIKPFSIIILSKQSAMFTPVCSS